MTSKLAAFWCGGRPPGWPRINDGLNYCDGHAVVLRLTYEVFWPVATISLGPDLGVALDIDHTWASAVVHQRNTRPFFCPYHNLVRLDTRRLDDVQTAVLLLAGEDAVRGMVSKEWGP